MQHTTLNPEQVLWRTKGRDWDYSFVGRPNAPALESWWSVFKHVFPGTETSTESLLQGKLTFEGATHEYAAATLKDPAAVDGAGRPVWHYLLWILPDGVTAGSIPGDWPHQFVRALSGVYMAASQLPSTSSPDLTAEISKVPPIELTTSPSEPHRRVSEVPEKKSMPVQTPANTQSPTANGNLKAKLGIALLAALLAGLAVAAYLSQSAD